MSSSLTRFSDRRNTHDGAPLSWGRVEEDGLPFRGPVSSYMRDEEAEVRARRVADVKTGFFDMLVPAQNKAYRDIMECVFNGWYQMVHLERFWQDTEGNRTTCHYVEWVEYYLEDSTMVRYAPAAIPQEFVHGR